MKQCCIIFFLIISNISFCQKKPYKVGEFAKYTISFGPLAVGHGELSISKLVLSNKIPTYYMIGIGKTSKFFDVFFKVRDVYETYIDTNTFLPVKFLRDVYEGGHVIKQEYEFNHEKNLVQTQNNQFKIPNESQDMLSAFFYARTFNKESVLSDSVFTIPIFMDDENYFLEVKYLYDEVIETSLGDIKCMVFQPKMQEGRVFEDGEDMKIWISDDENKMLYKVETKIWAGKIKAELTEYKNNLYPIIKI